MPRRRLQVVPGPDLPDGGPDEATLRPRSRVRGRIRLLRDPDFPQLSTLSVTGGRRLLIQVLEVVVGIQFGRVELKNHICNQGIA